MHIDVTHFTPGESLIGGLLIGSAVVLLILFNGRIAGISGILGGAMQRATKERGWRIAFLLGLLCAPWLIKAFGVIPEVGIDSSWAEIVIAGVLVGLGTRFASGCTSGHGVCGLSRGAKRSLVATGTFMIAGFLMASIIRYLIGH